MGVSQETDLDPKNPSSDYRAQIPFWAMVNAILEGVEALRAIQGYGNMPNVAGPAIPYAHLAMLNRGLLRTTSGRGSPYLPQFPNETDADYEMRRRHAPLANIYADISRNLASKPFSKTLQLDEKTAQDLVSLAENIDGRGNNIHVFARDAFKAALDNGLTWFLIDFPKVAPGTTLADERALGARPYFVHVPAPQLIAVYSEFIGGQEIIVHARIYEKCMEREGYGEETIERVRVFNREEISDPVTGETTGYADATWEIFELETNDTDSNAGTNAKANWVSVDSGPVTIGFIPLVPVVLGKRDGSSWRIDPPLKDLAYMQIEEFQQESNLKTIKELTAFPMLTGDGVPPPTGQDGKDTFVPVGPRSILYAPPQPTGGSGSWHFIEPSAQSLVFLQADLEKLRTEMRDLGMQPLATANLTVVTTANISMRAHSAIQAWALGLKDALEQAFVITCKWMNRTDYPTVNVHTDFGVDMAAGTEIDILLRAEGQGIFTPRTIWDEFKRRGVLADDFDPDAEEKALETSIDMESTTLLKAEAQGALSKITLWEELKRRSVLSDTFDPKKEEKELARQQQGLTPEVAIDPVTGDIVQPTIRPKLIGPANTFTLAGTVAKESGAPPANNPQASPPPAPVKGKA